MPDELAQKANQLIVGKLSAWFEIGVTMLPNLVLAVLVIVLFALFARAGRWAARYLFRRVFKQEVLWNAVSGFVYYMIMFTGLFLALSALQLDKTVTSLLAGAGVIGLALSFAFQDLATNLVSGLFITVQQPLKAGDLVKSSDFIGVVERIGFRSITIRDLDGQDIIIPSKDVFQSPLTNYSLINERRVSLELGVTYAADLDRVAEIVTEAISGLDVVNRRGVAVFWTGFGNSSIDLVARFWIDASTQAEHDRALSRALVAVKQAFDRNGITIPFPIRTLDFGIEGGVPLREVLADRTAPPSASHS